MRDTRYTQIKEMWNYTHNFVFAIIMLLKLYEDCGMLIIKKYKWCGNVLPFWHIFSLLFKCHFMATVTVFKNMPAKEQWKKYQGAQVFLQLPWLIRKICTLSRSSSHVSTLIKLKKKKNLISKLRNAMVNKTFKLGSSGHIAGFLYVVIPSSSELNLNLQEVRMIFQYKKYLI